jgi:hypothetical protein
MHPHLEIILFIKIKEKKNTMHQQNSSNFLLANGRERVKVYTNIATHSVEKESKSIPI